AREDVLGEFAGAVGLERDGAKHVLRQRVEERLGLPLRFGDPEIHQVTTGWRVPSGRASPMSWPRSAPAMASWAFWSTPPTRASALVSRSHFSTTKSWMYPAPPKSWTPSSATRQAAALAWTAAARRLCSADARPWSSSAAARQTIQRALSTSM